MAPKVTPRVARHGASPSATPPAGGGSRGAQAGSSLPTASPPPSPMPRRPSNAASSTPSVTPPAGGTRSRASAPPRMSGSITPPAGEGAGGGGDSSPTNKSACGSQSIRVAVRARPLNDAERQGNTVVPWRFFESRIEELKDDGRTPAGQVYNYDNVFGPDMSTEQVYERQMKGIVQGAMGGYNGTIFAYGQTSSGKTFSLMGDMNNPGITPRGVRDVFQWAETNSDDEFDVHASYIEIYNETITDLLQSDSKKGHNLMVKDDPALGPYIPEVVQFKVLNANMCSDLLKEGEKRRSFAATKMNAHSSRSHVIFALRIEARHGNSSGDNQDTGASMRDIAHSFLAMQQSIGADRASLYMVDRSTSELKIHTGEIQITIPMTQGIAGACATSGKTTNIPDAYADSRFNPDVDKKTGYRTKSILCVPIKNEMTGEVLGVVQFFNKNKPSGAAFDSNDETQAEELSNRIGPLIQKAEKTLRKTTKSMLNFVDLAGSERLAKTGAQGENLKEAGFINKSLMQLGYIISMLSDGKKHEHFPFRDSKLTRLLSTSLGGNTQTCLLCAMSPAPINKNETISTLQFAARAKKIVNKVTQNAKVNMNEMAEAYQNEIAKLKDQLANVERRNGRSSVHGLGESYCEQLGGGDGPGELKMSSKDSERLKTLEAAATEAEAAIQVLMNKNIDKTPRSPIPTVRIRVMAAICPIQGEIDHEDESQFVIMLQTSEGKVDWMSEERLHMRLHWLRQARRQLEERGPTTFPLCWDPISFFLCTTQRHVHTAM